MADLELPRLVVLSGLAGQPLSGSLDLAGTSLLDRRFSIDRGTITFGGAKPLISQLDIKASAEASGGFTGIVQITGPATEPKLERRAIPRRRRTR